MNKLEEAMYAYISGDSDVVNVTAQFEKAEKKPQAEECQAVYQEACQMECQAAAEIPEPCKPAEKAVEVEKELRICAECRYLFLNDRKAKWRRILATHLCAAEREYTRHPLTGERTVIGIGDCEKRNIRGDCKFYEEIPDCDLEFTEVQKQLYKMRLLKVYWDGFEQEWVRRFGLRK